MTAPAYPSASAVERGLDLLFPPLCVGCRRVGRWICADCWKKVNWLQSGGCGACGRPTSSGLCLRCAGADGALDSLLAVAAFDGAAREAVHALKYDGHHAISGMMGRLMADCARGHDWSLVAPVPLHPSRRRERGYDQSALLARRVASMLGRRFEPGLLRRVRCTEQQARLDHAARYDNMAGAFAALRQLPGESVLLIDDVSTTGATLQAAALALKEAGAGEVVGLVFAQAL